MDRRWKLVPLEWPQVSPKDAPWPGACMPAACGVAPADKAPARGGLRKYGSCRGSEGVSRVAGGTSEGGGGAGRGGCGGSG